MLGIDGVGDRRSSAILARKFLYGKLGTAGRKKRDKKRREMVSKQPSSTAEIR
jgi:hypothetical protein